MESFEQIEAISGYLGQRKGRRARSPVWASSVAAVGMRPHFWTN